LAKKGTTMMNRFRVLLAAFQLLCTVPLFADEAKVTTWHSQNVVWDIDYADGTLAIGTRTGLLVLRDGALRHFMGFLMAKSCP